MDNKEKELFIPETVYRFKSEEEYKKALNASPPASWVKDRSLGGSKKSKYVPLYIQQSVADQIFQQWDVVSQEYTVVVNEILCTVKIQYIPSYPGADFRICTGVAAKPIQCDSASVPSLFPKGKKTNAVEYNAPAARSAAISNAFTALGNVLGRNLNRDTANDYSMDKKEDKK